jgi:ubiquinone/menaquinone biosynthesis C-methylase UbiE
MNRPVFARLYPHMSKAMEQAGMAEHRRTLLSALTGEIIEIGAGDGTNFTYYPRTVTRVTAVEPEPHLRRLAQAASRQAPIPVQVLDGCAEDLRKPDKRFDAAVFSFVLCTVPDLDAALAEALRVLKPGGHLRFLEHVRADSHGHIRVQRLLDATVWPLLVGGCHTGRDTAGAITRAGFTIEQLDHFLFPDVRTPISFHILGTASRPSAASNDH